MESVHNFGVIVLNTTVDLLGKGSISCVYKTKLPVKNVPTTVAIKKFTDEKLAEKEVEHLVSFNHKHIIRVLGLGSHDLVPCLVLEFADCGSMYDVVHRPVGDLPVPYTRGHALSWMRQVASALAYLHKPKPVHGKGSLPMLHRDLKPANILLTNKRRTAKLCDFGYATVQRSEMTNKRGTIFWMAPEVFDGTHYSTKCDVYSLGICLWEVLVGQLPDELHYRDADGNLPDMSTFKGNMVMWYTSVMKRDPPLRPSPMTGVTKLDHLIKEAWAKDPDSRPTAAEMCNRLSHALMNFPGGDAALPV